MNIREKATQVASSLKNTVSNAIHLTKGPIESVRHKANVVKNDVRTLWELTKITGGDAYRDIKYKVKSTLKGKSFSDDASYTLNKVCSEGKKYMVMVQSSYNQINEELRHAKAEKECYEPNPLVEDGTTQTHAYNDS